MTKKYLIKIIGQGRPTCGPRAAFGPHKGFEWPAQYFSKPSVASILAKFEDRFDVKTPFFLFFSCFRDHYDFGQKVENVILGEDFFFFLEITMILV